METNGKRKHDDASGGSGGGRGGGSHFKRSKGGNQGKWMTPSHKAKMAALRGRSLEVGDQGFWVTCQRHKEMKAADEILSMCDEYGKKLFGIDPDGAKDGAGEEEAGAEENEDIETAIEKELAAMREPTVTGKGIGKGEGGGKPKDAAAPFDLLKMNVDCVLFMRTRAPVDPLALVREISRDAAAAVDRSVWRSRFINKLTPITLTGKATEKGLEEVANKVLAAHFRLGEDGGEGEDEAFSYAIRPTIRAHTTLKRIDVINKVASMISNRHKVELKNPDKVIIIEIFQTFLGMSVVGKDWEAMKRYNIHELYAAAAKSAGDSEEPEKPIEVEGEDKA
ncbi:putative THUMP domain-containing protein [Rosellinia necatrix]|uniref:Putative THUMP domain-containing protein n=1 Tax=Rosellinia necatrix TaxID=77044 RepID=A0A1W2TNA0_ROSNE|nr:putative THUMP domain-containing protein [Rosellinia necatrix]